MKKIHLFLLAGALALATTVQAEPGEGPGPGHDGPGMHEEGGGPGPERMLEKLGLSQAQKDKLKALRRARRDKNQAAQNALRDSQEDLREMLAKSDSSADKLRAKHEEVQKLQAASAKERFESMLEIRSILTPEQLKKFVEFKPGQMGERKKGRKGGMKRDGKEDRP